MDRHQSEADRPQGRKIGYVRVSDKDQSEALQIDALTGAGCDLIFGDHGVSGVIRNRMGLKDVLATLKQGDTLIVWKLDRLSRSSVQLIQLLDDLRQRGIDFKALTQGIDTTTAIGRMLYGQLAVFAEFERENIRERTKAGMEAARKRGKRIGRPKSLTPAQIRTCAKHISNGDRHLSDIAKELGVSPRTIARAIDTKPFERAV